MATKKTEATMGILTDAAVKSLMAGNGPAL